MLKRAHKIPSLLSLILWSVFFSPSYAQVEPHATITLANGMVETIPITPCGGATEALCLYYRNPGYPDNWESHEWTPGPIFFSRLEAELPPGYTVLTKDIMGIRQNGTHFTLLYPQQYHMGSFRYGRVAHPVYRPQSTYHTIDGGGALYFRFVKFDPQRPNDMSKSDPWELSYIESVDAAAINKIIEIYDFDYHRIFNWPYAQRLVDLYRLDASSINPQTVPGERNAAWLLFNFPVRWPTAIENGYKINNTYFGFGSTANREGLSNEHYGHDAWYMAQGIFNSDPQSLQLGLYLLRQKIANGLILSDSVHRDNNRWRNEKSHGMRGTTGMRPSPAKAWDLSLVVAHTLFPKDVLIAEAFERRKEYWKTVPRTRIWNGVGGARNLGNALRNMSEFYIHLKDSKNPDDMADALAIKRQAESFITHAFSAEINTMQRPYFREGYHYPLSDSTRDVEISCGEGVNALSYSMRWVYDHGVRRDLEPHLQSMLAWYLGNCGQWVSPDKFMIGYNVNPQTNVITFAGGTHGTFFMPLSKYARPSQRRIFAGIEKFIYEKYIDYPQCDAACPSMGPSAEKRIPIYFESLRR